MTTMTTTDLPEKGKIKLILPRIGCPRGDVKEYIARAAALDRQAWWLQHVLDAIESASNPHMPSPEDVMDKEKKFWRISKQDTDGAPRLKNGPEIVVKINRLKKAAKEFAHEAWQVLPVRTEIVGWVATAWHTGCPHLPASKEKWAVENAVMTGIKRQKTHGFVFWRTMVSTTTTTADLKPCGSEKSGKPHFSTRSLLKNTLKGKLGNSGELVVITEPRL